jgi:DNA-binding response OmpR family regulator
MRRCSRSSREVVQGLEEGTPGVRIQLVIDTAAREVTVDGQKIELTRLEFDLLDLLSADPGVVFSRARLRG